MKIYLIRHGETTGDVEDGRSYDDHLTDLGKRQIEETAEKMTDKNIEIIFTSGNFILQKRKSWNLQTKPYLRAYSEN